MYLQIDYIVFTARYTATRLLSMTCIKSICTTSVRNNLQNSVTHRGETQHAKRRVWLSKRHTGINTGIDPAIIPSRNQR